jgi:hypothetical protein
MKHSEKIWVERLAQASLTRPALEIKSQLQQYIVMFIDELCHLVVDYISYFNEIVTCSDNFLNKTQTWTLFQLTSPRLGLIATREKDKLVITDEGKGFHIKMVQSCLQSERLHESLFFEPQISDLGTINWHCVNDGQYVNPELVVKTYLATFFAYGCKGISKPYPRLVAVGDN